MSEQGNLWGASQVPGKVCTRCSEYKPYTSFSERDSVPDGRNSWCKMCESNSTKERYATLKGRAMQLMVNKRLRCEKRGLPFDLTVEWYLRSLRHGVCEATGLLLDIESRSSGPFAPAIDQIKPNAGYTKKNCRVVCNVYNQAKREWSDEDVLKMARALVKRHSAK